MSAGGGSLAASQGMRAATAQLAEELALRNHPEVMEQLSKGAWGDKRNLASGNPCMYRIVVFAKTLDFTVSQSASFTISAVPFSKSNRSSPHSPSLSTKYS